MLLVQVPRAKMKHGLEELLALFVLYEKDLHEDETNQQPDKCLNVM